MKLIYLPLLVLLGLFNLTLADPIDKVAELIGKGNTPEIAKLFAVNVDITLMDDANTYPKAQAQILLEKFFAENKPISGKMLHKIASNASYSFGVVLLNTDKGIYRIAFTLKDADGSMQIIELRIEREKVK